MIKCFQEHENVQMLRNFFGKGGGRTIPISKGRDGRAHQGLKTKQRQSL